MRRTCAVEPGSLVTSFGSIVCEVCDLKGRGSAAQGFGSSSVKWGQSYVTHGTEGRLGYPSSL